MSNLKSYLPWTADPLIINAPMAGFAGPALACAVTQSGGFGFIGGLFTKDELRSQMQEASKILKSNPSLASGKTLPIGLSFLPFIAKIDDCISVVEEFKPAVVWVFAARELDDYQTWASRVRSVSPETKIWIQCGSVAAALHIAKTAKPEALCLQGADAGGHGFEKGAGIISLVPEVSDVFAKEGIENVALLASGGIVDGRSVAAALALGAQGVVMGTRFLAAKEAKVHPKYRAAILEAHDGGQVTTRSKLFDELSGPNIWPGDYDGRSLAVQSYVDFKNGVGIEQIQKLHNEAKKEEDMGFDTGFKGRAAIWAGTGVGIVNEIESAGTIVEKVRNDAESILRRLSKM